jgi:UDP-N-acetylglucosamine--N-acetylmuramyl-(pentapeptide) pyrophosphoryl-undecaprenol N-acetylglucosamine transferase
MTHAEQTQQPLVFVMAGGTGGHVIPALAVAQGLSEKGCQIRWLGTVAGIEAKLVPAAGFAVDWLAIGGLRGKSWLTRLVTPWRLLRATIAARNYFTKHQPALVLGLGGYASGPGGLAARWLGIPLIIHEQNAVAGLTNRVLSRIANQTLAAYVSAFAKQPKHFTVVGNPVRPEIAALPAPTQRFVAQRGVLRILVLGGSLGAQALNELVPAALARLSQIQPLAIKHQTGSRHLEQTRTNYGHSVWSPESTTEVVDFIDDMAAAYSWADFVIARAGALTVAEISVAGLGALFVPFPHAVDDHQTQNAANLVKVGAAILLAQRDLSVAKLVEVLEPIWRDRDHLRDMAEAARKQALPQATETMVRICLETIALNKKFAQGVNHD